MKKVLLFILLESTHEVIGVPLKTDLWIHEVLLTICAAFFHQLVCSVSMAKSMSLLLGDGSPPCQQVMIALEEKKLQGYKHKVLSFEKGEHTFQEVLEINPRGHVGLTCIRKMCKHH